MAQKIIRQLVSDLDGGDADETVTFMLDGAEFEIDVSAADARRLRDVLAEFARCARRTGGRKRYGSAVTDDGPKPGVVRDWANANGHPVNDRGRIPIQVMAAYAEAHPAPTPPKSAPKRAPKRAPNTAPRTAARAALTGAAKPSAKPPAKSRAKPPAFTDTKPAARKKK